MTRPRLWVLGMLMVVLGLVSPSAPVVGQSAPEVVGLAPGDALRITVWRQPELSGEFSVALDGTLVHPIYREVQVTGIPVEEVESRIRLLLSRYEAEPRFSLEPLVRVAVEGEVRQPSLYTVPTAVTVAQAVAMAGGATERGRLAEVRVYRAGEVLEVDLTDPDARLAESPVRSGDRIVVGRRPLIFRDYVAPIASLAGAAAAIANLIIRSRN